MNYIHKNFTVSLTSDKYAEGWDRIFGAQKEPEESRVCCFDTIDGCSGRPVSIWVHTQDPDRKEHPMCSYHAEHCDDVRASYSVVPATQQPCRCTREQDCEQCSRVRTATR